MQLEGLYLDKAHEVKLPIHLNMAACQIATGDYHTAVHNCSEVWFQFNGHILGHVEECILNQFINESWQIRP